MMDPAVFAHRDLPGAAVDLDAFDANLSTLVALLPPGVSLRIASKSVRVPALLTRALEHPRTQGLMTFHPRETLNLARAGFDDLFLAYPVARPHDAALVAEAAGHARVLATLDHIAQAQALSAAAQQAEVTVEVALDIDLSLRVGPLHFGVRRSPLRSVAEACTLAQDIGQLPGLHLRGVLGYEAQIAGVPDRNPTSRLLDPVRQWIKQRSLPLAERRRAAVVEALRANGWPIDLVNGGGTGSLHSSARAATVTEVTAGSGLFCPHLFDHYRGLELRPALWLAFAANRRPDPDCITLGGGGWVASGTPGWDRTPQPPAGLKAELFEGWGEVQTPLRGRAAASIALGETVFCRPAKAGEVLDHVDHVVAVGAGQAPSLLPTHRGATGDDPRTSTARPVAQASTSRTG